MLGSVFGSVVGGAVVVVVLLCVCVCYVCWLRVFRLRVVGYVSVSVRALCSVLLL